LRLTYDGKSHARLRQKDVEWACSRCVRCSDFRICRCACNISPTIRQYGENVQTQKTLCYRPAAINGSKGQQCSIELSSRCLSEATLAIRQSQWHLYVRKLICLRNLSYFSTRGLCHYWPYSVQQIILPPLKYTMRKNYPPARCSCLGIVHLDRIPFFPISNAENPMGPRALV
jgi:hypothetical protein